MRIISINNNIPSNNNTKINFGWGKLPEGAVPTLRVYPIESLPLMEKIAFSSVGEIEKTEGKNLFKKMLNIFRK